jgi:hypothetical protein
MPQLQLELGAEVPVRDGVLQGLAANIDDQSAHPGAESQRGDNGDRKRSFLAKVRFCNRDGQEVLGGHDFRCRKDCEKHRSGDNGHIGSRHQLGAIRGAPP